MNNLKEYLFNQLQMLIDSDVNSIEDNGNSITLITSIHFNSVHITVSKGKAVAGWTRKNTSKNDYSLAFQITPLNDEQINIEVFSYGLVANATLIGEMVDGVQIWKFDNFNNTDESFYNSSYPYIQFTASLNKQNQFTEFIAYVISQVKNCLNNEVVDYIDETLYDTEPENSKVPEGDLILSIREDTWKDLSKRAMIKLSNDTLLPITKDLIGKKVVRKDSNPTIFYPLYEKEFIQNS